jgi:hypothetical protein
MGKLERQGCRTDMFRVGNPRLRNTFNVLERVGSVVTGLVIHDREMHFNVLARVGETVVTGLVIHDQEMHFNVLVRVRGAAVAGVR